MSKSKQQKLTVAEALKLWLGGKGRSELAEATGLGRGELRKRFVALSKKTWAQLNAESGRKRAKGTSKKAKVA
jgi:hypothetical protein